MSENQKIAEQTAQEDAALRERTEAFNKELIELLGKYELGLRAFAKLTPDGRIAAFPVLVDANELKKQAEEQEKQKEESKVVEA